MESTRQLLRKIVDESGLSLRAFAAAHGHWDHAHLTRTLNGEYAVGPSTIGRVLVGVKDPKIAADLIEAYLAEQRALIDAERKRFERAEASGRGRSSGRST